MGGFENLLCESTYSYLPNCDRSGLLLDLKACLSHSAGAAVASQHHAVDLQRTPIGYVV